ncbi:MAG: type IX secretion system sortase PorU [Cyclobacteriaceae bacterium]|nr:type IX secretion system sortase PorU [Cyclobacteriaceae bacterium]
MQKTASIALKSIAILVAIVLTSFPVNAQQSVLASGTWHKLAVEKNGVYKIDQALFRKMGFPSNTDPRNIKIYTHGAGMLPQLNSAPRPNDLVECTIFVEGESDGVFNQQDYILFYAEGADKVSFDTGTETFSYEKHLYAKENFYFITVGNNAGKRIGTSPNAGTSFPVIEEFDNYAYHEVDQYNMLKSGRDWYGERFDFTDEHTIRFNLPGIIQGSPVKLTSSVMAYSFNATSFNVFYNNVQVGEHPIAGVPNTLGVITLATLAGRHSTQSFITNSSGTQTTQEVRYKYNKNGSATGYLDYCLLHVKQQLRLYENQIIFRSSASLQNPESTFRLTQSTAQTQVWDITDPFTPTVQQTSFNAATTSFGTSTTNLKEFIAFSATAPAPKLVGSVPNQNIRALPTPHLLIVAHPSVKEETLRFKAYRESFSNIDIQVIHPQEIYNEFSGGKQDITAIRDAVKYFYDKNPGKLNALLLVGKSSYDYKDIVVDNKNLVPTYQSRNSLSYVFTYSSDDYYGFLENHEGQWSEGPSPENHTLDIAVGRIPVKSTEEMKNVVDKIIKYDTDKKRFGRWRKTIVFVADDGDLTANNVHQTQADQMATSINLHHGHFDTKKIYLDAFPQIPGAGGTISPETKKQIDQSINDGALIINYTGHGSERQWAQERILDEIQIQNLKNKNLPLLVTATCEFGRQDDPMFPSGAELFILQPNAGAIGLVTTARPVSSNTNFDLNQAFYDAFFQKENGNNLSLGEIFRRTKNNSISGVFNRNFSLIGDPSLHLAIPTHDINVTSITTSSGSDTLKALSTVTVTGEIVNHEQEKIETFNGTVEATLFDKETSFRTLGNENTPFDYKQWFNALFRGRAKAEAGEFTFQFIVPKNIAYAIDEGKLSLYAYDKNSEEEAAGYSTNFMIGSSESNPPTDTSPPEIKLYLNDLTFTNGGITGSAPTLIAQLADESGINISGYGIGNSIIAVLDDDETLVLNDYYIAEPNDYTKGTIEFTLPELKPGPHTITLRAWDTHNNPGLAKIDFRVSGTNALVIESFAGYPNPMRESAQLYFTHNQAGNDLEAVLMICDRTGQSVQEYTFSIQESAYEVNLLELSVSDNPGKKLAPGIYLARLIVRSLADGSKNERVTKLIVLN